MVLVSFWLSPPPLQKEKFHTHLAVLYVERVLALLSQAPPAPQEQVGPARDKLQLLLRESSLYRVQLLLGEITSVYNGSSCPLSF